MAILGETVQLFEGQNTNRLKKNPMEISNRCAVRTSNFGSRLISKLVGGTPHAPAQEITRAPSYF